MHERILGTFRDAFHRGDYEVTLPHFLEELAEDDLLMEDAETAILSGRIVRRLSRDPRGIRYVIRGETPDGRTIEVVGRIKSNRRALLITVYLV